MPKSKSRMKKQLKRVLALPDLEQAKAAVLCQWESVPPAPQATVARPFTITRVCQCSQGPCWFPLWRVPSSLGRQVAAASAGRRSEHG